MLTFLWCTELPSTSGVKNGALMRFHDSAAYVDSWRCGSSLGFGTELA